MPVHSRVQKAPPRKFFKEFSVFKDTLVDDSTVVSECLDHDQSWWLSGELLKKSKDREDTKKIQVVLRDHLPRIKSLLLHLSLQGGSYPMVYEQTLT